MSALIQARLTPRATSEAMGRARHFAGREAYAKQIVDGTASGTDARSAVIALAAQDVTKADATLATIKTRMYAGVREKA